MAVRVIRPGDASANPGDVAATEDRLATTGSGVAAVRGGGARLELAEHPSSSAEGARRLDGSAANFTGQPHCACDLLARRAGIESDVTVSSRVSGSGSITQRSVMTLVGPLVFTPSASRLSGPEPWPSEVMKGSFSTKARCPSPW